MGVVWWKPRVFAQVGSTLTFSLTICTALLGNSLLQRSSSITKLVFRAIQNSSPNFLFFSPPTISLFVFKTKHLKNVKCHRAVDHLLLTKSTSFKTYTGEIRKWKLSNETNRVSPPKSKSWNPSPPWVWSFTSKLTFPLHFNSWVRAHRKGAQNGPQSALFSNLSHSLQKRSSRHKTNVYFGGMLVSKSGLRFLRSGTM